MKRSVSFLFWLVFALSLCAQPQSDRKVDVAGNLLYQYCRSATKNPANSSEVLVMFVFINGKQQTAISYRQEHIGKSVKWIDTEGAHFVGGSLVDALTANLSPNDSVVWTFAIDRNFKDKSGTTVESAAILLMDDSSEVKKFYFDEQKVK